MGQQRGLRRPSRTHPAVAPAWPPLCKLPRVAVASSEPQRARASRATEPPELLAWKELGQLLS
jgi:hypothetical protein